MEKSQFLDTNQSPDIKMAAAAAAAPPAHDGAKTWKFTLNNWTVAERDNILHWDVQRMAVAEETGEEGTPHLQGHVTFPRKMRLAALKKMLSRAHWEPALVADWNYEHKDGQVVHHIDNRKQGKRRDIDTAHEYAAQKKTMREFVSEQKPGYQAMRAYEKILDVLSDPRPIQPIDVRWYFGPTGAGKTRSVYEEFPTCYRVLSHKWWDGYRGQETVLVDDYRASWCRFEELLRLTDMYPFRVEVKGGSCEVGFKRIIITAPIHPAELFSACGEDIGQLLRRITILREWRADGTYFDHA